MNKILASVALTAVALSYGTTVSAADLVANHGDWTVMVDASPKSCWLVSGPLTSKAVEGGKDVTANTKRGDILLYVTFTPSEGISGEVAFAGGYPFKPDAPVIVDVGGKKRNMNSSGETAWPDSPSEDTALVASFKAGSSATLIGQSQRGKTTTDVFSLKGFTAAYNEASTRCK